MWKIKDKKSCTSIHYILMKISGISCIVHYNKHMYTDWYVFDISYQSLGSQDLSTNVSFSYYTASKGFPLYIHEKCSSEIDNKLKVHQLSCLLHTLHNINFHSKLSAVFASTTLLTLLHLSTTLLVNQFLPISLLNLNLLNLYSLLQVLRSFST